MSRVKELMKCALFKLLGRQSFHVLHNGFVLEMLIHISVICPAPFKAPFYAPFSGPSSALILHSSLYRSIHEIPHFRSTFEVQDRGTIKRRVLYHHPNEWETGNP